MRLIVIAGIIAFPISYLVMNYWLQGAYRIQIQIWWLVGNIHHHYQHGSRYDT